MLIDAKSSIPDDSRPPRSRRKLTTSPRKLVLLRTVNGRQPQLFALPERTSASLWWCTAVAVAWLLAKPWVSSVILGARTPEQLAGTLAAAELVLPAEAEERLDALSAPPLIYPYWHQRRMARLGEAEAPMLRGSRATLRRLSEGTLPPAPS
jgi:hypothetical protein